MSDQQKTISFVGTAVVTLLLAVATHHLTQPAESTGFELVGTEFFEDFEGGSQAGSLEVLAIDPDSTNLKQFRVEEKDGVWTIPSHFGYPAEAADRLATTASSLIGLTRESLAGRLKTEHEKFGVLDPLGEDNLDPESTGKRVTIKDKSGEVLVDLIIGKEAAETKATDSQLAFGQEAGLRNFYVRRPDEPQTFKVALDLELSTRFSDWIRPDLLNLNGADVRQIDIDNYELVEQADPLGRVTSLYKTQGDQMKFSRDTGFGPWTMEGLDVDTNNLDSTKINSAVTKLDNLKIVGVRKKMTYKDQQLLSANFEINEIEELEKDRRLKVQVFGQFQQELSDYGFNLTPVAQNSNELTIVSNTGQISAGTSEGVLYTLQFGNPVSGDEDEIEIGISPSKSDESSAANDDEESQGESEAATDSTDGDKASDGAEEDVKNRYLMIRVSFEESLLGEKPERPTAPQEPEKPEGYVPASDHPNDAENAENQDDAPAPEGEETKPAEGEDTGEQAETEEQAETDARPQEFKDYDLALATYKQEQTEYELKLTQFEEKQKEFDEKIADGEKRVAELNERFGKWFYVISADNLDSLQLKKADLVSEKEKVETTETPAFPGGLPERPNLNLDDVMPMIKPPTESTEGPGETEEPASADKKDETPAATEPDESNAEQSSEEGKTGVEDPESKDPEQPADESESAPEPDEDGSDSSSGE